MGLYRIKGIYHSGRKGLRMSPVTEYKYDGLISCQVNWDIDYLRQFKCTRFWLENHSKYSWWDTSPVIQLTKKDSNIYVLETINTIYELEILE